MATQIIQAQPMNSVSMMNHIKMRPNFAMTRLPVNPSDNKDVSRYECTLNPVATFDDAVTQTAAALHSTR